MSFILDALRKSDTERQQSQTPGIADHRYQVPTRRGRSWAPLLIIVLCANALLLLIVLIDRSTDADTTTVAVNLETPEDRPASGIAPNLDTITAEAAERRPLVEEATTTAQPEPAEPRVTNADQAAEAAAAEATAMR